MRIRWNGFPNQEEGFGFMALFQDGGSTIPTSSWSGLRNAVTDNLVICMARGENSFQAAKDIWIGRRLGKEAISPPA